MAIHSSTLAWKIPWMEEPDRLQSMGSQRVKHDWATSLFTRWRGGCDRGLGAFTSVCLQKTSATTLIRVLSVIFWYSNNIFWLLHLEKVQSLQNWISLYVRESSLNIQQTSALRLNLTGRIWSISSASWSPKEQIKCKSNWNLTSKFTW